MKSRSEFLWLLCTNEALSWRFRLSKNRQNNLFATLLAPRSGRLNAAGGELDCIKVKLGGKKRYRTGLNAEEQATLALRFTADLPLCVREHAVLSFQMDARRNFDFCNAIGDGHSCLRIARRADLRGPTGRQQSTNNS